MNSGDQEMMELFVQESSEHIQTLETDLISLESNPADDSLLNSIFRSVHSIKGAAGFFGFDPIVKLAHVMESVMSLLRDGQIQADPDMVSLLISTSDKLRLMLSEPEAARECLGVLRLLAHGEHLETVELVETREHDVRERDGDIADDLVGEA